MNGFFRKFIPRKFQENESNGQVGKQKRSFNQALKAGLRNWNLAKRLEHSRNRRNK
ncbi:MAG: hypothetical protein PHW31_03355 [Candidatus Pacebacteria bacterium]|nr:hypothetical protein [Candidatus Paceibacterota bacterium]